MSDYREVARFQDKRDYLPYIERSGNMPLRVNDMAWSPDNGRIAVAHTDLAVRIWNIAGKFDEPENVFPHTKFVVSVAWSPVGDKIASGDTQADPVRIWDVESCIELRTMWGHESWPLSIDWSPSGRYAMSGGQDGAIILWDTYAEEPDHRFYVYIGKSRTVSTIRWNHQKYMVAAYLPKNRSYYQGVWTELEQAVLIFDTRTWQIQHQLSLGIENTSHGCLLDWSPNGRYLAVLGDHAKVHLWDISESEATEIAVLQPTELDNKANKIGSVSWNRNGHSIACVVGTDTIYLWEDGIPQQPLMVNDDDKLFSTKWSPDGKYLAVGGLSGIVRVFSKANE